MNVFAACLEDTRPHLVTGYSVSIVNRLRRQNVIFFSAVVFDSMEREKTAHLLSGLGSLHTRCVCLLTRTFAQKHT